MFNKSNGRWGRLVVSAALGVLALVSTAGVALSADGDIDTAFGTNGKVQYDFAGKEDDGYKTVVLNDGKILIAGVSTQAASADFALLRLNANGTLDTSFGTGGKVTSDFPGGLDDDGSSLALQTDGKIVVVGTSNEAIALARYNSNGSLDTSFSEDGLIRISLRNTLSAGYDVAIDSSGRIIIGGAVGSKFALLRYNSDGNLDSSFSSDGLAITNFPGYVTKVAFYGAKIVVAGASDDSRGSIFTALRFNEDGELDTTFGTGGITKVAFDSTTVGAYDMTLQLDGKIVLVGGVVVGSDPLNFALARLNSDGTLDTSFGTGGKVITAFNDQSDSATSVVIDEGGKIVAGGYLQIAATRKYDFALARYNANGTLDTSFSGDGKVDSNSTGGRGDGIFDLALAPGGKLLAVGTTFLTDSFDSGNFAAARYNSCNPTFSDVRTTDFYYGPVRYLACSGIISGYGDNTFRPFANTTRSQLAKIVVGAQDWAINTTGGPHFSDVTPNNPFYAFVETAYNRGVISGYNDATRCAPSAAACFKPFDNVTRGQLSKIVVQAQGWQLIDPTTPTFVDVSRSNTFYEYVETAVAKGIISGYQVGSSKEFRPGANATRGQISKIVYLTITSPDTLVTTATEKASK